jgi:hypothetical protein
MINPNPIVIKNILLILYRSGFRGCSDKDIISSYQLDGNHESNLKPIIEDGDFMLRQLSSRAKEVKLSHKRSINWLILLNLIASDNGVYSKKAHYTMTPLGFSKLLKVVEAVTLDNGEVVRPRLHDCLHFFADGAAGGGAEDEAQFLSWLA